MGYGLTLLIVIFDRSNVSRLQIFLSCSVFLILEIIVWSILFRITQNRYPESPSISIEMPKFTRVGPKSSFFLFSMDLVFVFAAFFIVNFLKRGHLDLLEGYDLLLLILIGLWAFTAVITDKFNKQQQKHGFYYLIWQWFKADAFMFAMISVVVFSFRLFEFSRFQGFAPVIVLFLIEWIFLWFYYIWYENKDTKDIETIEEVQKLHTQDDLQTDIDTDMIIQGLLKPVRDKLQKKLLPEKKRCI